MFFDLHSLWEQKRKGKEVSSLLEAQGVEQRKQIVDVERILPPHFLGTLLTSIISPCFPL